MKRRLLKTLAVLSLVFGVATVALWMRSYLVGDVVGYGEVDATTARARALYSGRGVLAIYQIARPRKAADGKGGLEWGHIPTSQIPPSRWKPPIYLRFGSNWVAEISDWLLVTIAMVMPAMVIRRAGVRSLQIG